FDFGCCSPAIAPHADSKILRPQIYLSFFAARVRVMHAFFICDADIGNAWVIDLVKYIGQLYWYVRIYLESAAVKEACSGMREQPPFLDDKTLFLGPQVQ